MYILCLLIFLVIPFVVSPVVFSKYVTIHNRRYVFISSVFFALVMSILGYCFIEPKTDPDIVRYFEMISLYEGKKITECFNIAYDNLFVVDILFYFIAKIGDYQILPLVSVFTFYLIAFYIMADYRIRKKLPTKYFIVFLVFLLCSVNFTSTINTFRNYIAFELFFLGVYREFIQKKKNIFTYICYIIPSMLHFSALLLLMIRISMLISNKVLKRLSIAIVFVPYALTALVSAIGSISSSNVIVSQIIYFINRANMYFQWSDTGWAEVVKKSRFRQFTKLYYLILIICVFIFAIYYYRRQKKLKKDVIKLDDNFRTFSILYLFVTLETFVIVTPMYNRFVSPAIPMICIYGYEFILSENLKKNTRFVFQMILLALSAVGIMINLYYLNTMMELGEYFRSIVTFSFIFN